MTTNKDKQRAEFEDWAANRGYPINLNSVGDYDHTATDHAWSAWQAAQQAIRLPDEMTCETDNIYTQGHTEGWNDCLAETCRLNGLGDK